MARHERYAPDRASLTAAQAEIWLAEQLTPGTAQYDIAEYLEIDGPVDAVLFERALRQVVCGGAEPARAFRRRQRRAATDPVPPDRLVPSGDRRHGSDRVLQKTPSGFDVSVWEFSSGR
ncbi:hypothetical protein [Ensifer sp. BR816]|uniref:hypothetical protein n=1 Tax=Rhizobium sp. (strain BR816) TaxID=1057002 RepID=UPI0003A8A6D6|nr:hypothetical protein [Ensifer sp. BR816]